MPQAQIPSLGKRLFSVDIRGTYKALSIVTGELCDLTVDNGQDVHECSNGFYVVRAADGTYAGMHRSLWSSILEANCAIGLSA